MRALMRLILLLVVGGGGYYYYAMHPPTRMERAVDAALTGFNEVVATKDAKNITQFLQDYLRADASITLEIRWAAYGVATQQPTITQTFTRDDFIRFLELTIYPLSDYTLTSELAQFTMTEALVSANVTTRHDGSATGKSYALGQGVHSRYVLNAECTGEAMYELANDTLKATLQQANCAVRLSIAAAANPQEIQGFMQRLREGP